MSTLFTFCCRFFLLGGYGCNHTRFWAIKRRVLNKYCIFDFQQGCLGINLGSRFSFISKISSFSFLTSSPYPCKFQQVHNICDRSPCWPQPLLHNPEGYPHQLLFVWLSVFVCKIKSLQLTVKLILEFVIDPTKPTKETVLAFQSQDQKI